MDVPMEGLSCFPLVDLFLCSAKSFPHNIAVIFNHGNNKISHDTFYVLASESKKVSSCLSEIGLKSEVKPNLQGFVGLYMEQTLCLPALILGVLRLGAGFICLDPKMHDEDRTKLIRQLNISWILTVKNQLALFQSSQHNFGDLRKEMEVHGIIIEFWKVLLEESVTTDKHCGKMKFMYAISTSGSTGKPKLVKVPHECIAPNIQHLRTILDVRPVDTIFLASPLTFDPFVVELFLALTSGAAILIVSNIIKASPNLLIDALFPQTSQIYSGITILQSTPSIVSRWSLESINNTLLGPHSTLRVLVLGGEPCPDLDILKQWKTNKSKTDIYNIYGITEVSCWASIYKVDILKISSHIPLGNTLSETVLQIRNTSGDAIKNGEGELFVGSSTRICIIDNEEDYDISLPVYRATGDIVNVDSANNQITYKGRKDAMVKRWGHRVDLAQIEHIAILNNNVERCFCIWEKSVHKLGLFIKFKINELVKSTDNIPLLRMHLAKNLMSSSIPDVIISISEFPLTLHGKIDTQNLLATLKAEFETAIDWNDYFKTIPVISVLRILLLKYFNCIEITPDDNFVSLGGNSFVAAQIMSEIEISHPKIPSSFILMLLSGSTFRDCHKYLRLIRPMSIKCKANFDLELKSNLPNSAKGDGVLNRREGTHVQSTHMTDKTVLIAMCRGRRDEYCKPNQVSINVTTLHNIENISMEIGWKFNLNKCVDASPLVIQLHSGLGLVVIGSHAHGLAVLNCATGTLTSKLCILKDRIESSACVSRCGETALVGCYDGCVYGIDLETCETVWQYNTGSMVKCSPTLCLQDTAITVGSYNNMLYCIQIKDGSLVWSMTPGSGSIYSSPCVSQLNGVIFVGTLDGTCCGVMETDGSVVWRHVLGSPVFASPVLVTNEQQVLFAEVLGLVHGFSADQGVKLWTFKASGNIFSSFCAPPPGISKQIVLFGCHDSHIYCLEYVDNDIVNLKWKTSLDSSVFATPFAFSFESHENCDSVELVAVATTKGSLYLIDFVYGTVRCFYLLPHEIFSSPVVYKNQLIVGCRDNNVYSLNILSS